MLHLADKCINLNDDRKAECRIDWAGMSIPNGGSDSGFLLPTILLHPTESLEDVAGGLNIVIVYPVGLASTVGLGKHPHFLAWLDGHVVTANLDGPVRFQIEYDDAIDVQRWNWGDPPRERIENAAPVGPAYGGAFQLTQWRWTNHERVGFPRLEADDSGKNLEEPSFSFRSLITFRLYQPITW